jgi:type II secretory pathway component PulF
MGGELVLIVEDDEDIRELVSYHLLKEGYQVASVASGEEAGILPEMLAKAADLLDKDADKLAASLLVKLEPALTVLMGLVIGLILMGVYLPMFDYMAHLR